MSLALYMDEHVKRAVTLALRARGIDVLTAQEDDRRGRPDPELLDRALELNRVMFSQDEDLLAEATDRQRAGVAFTGVIYAHQLNIGIGQCVRDLELLAKAVTPD